MTRRGGPKSKPSASSRSANKASDGVPTGSEDAVIRDFLYYDATRVGSFLAQVDEGGHLKEVVQSESVSKADKPGFGVKLAGTLPAVPGVTIEGAEGSLSFNRNPGQSGSETGQRKYDPFWANARTFIDFLEGAGLLGRDLASAPVGQLVLTSGHLSVLDVRILRAALALPAFSASALAAAAAAAGGDPTATTNNGLGLELLTVLPMELQATITNASGSCWMTLVPDHMTGSSADLMLKHGHQIAGQWSVVGVLDALPDQGGVIDPSVQAAMPNAINSAASFATNAAGLIAMMIAPMARFALGRPAASFGITPLLIFREVSGRLGHTRI